MRRHARSLLAASAIAALLASYIVFLHTPPGPRSLRNFDPDRVAELEVGMWQAYYKTECASLRTARDHAPRAVPVNMGKAATAGFYLARPAARFAAMKGDYETVLPDLERAFTMTKEWTGAG